MSDGQRPNPTGRLGAESAPQIQNLPLRTEEARRVREAFAPNLQQVPKSSRFFEEMFQAEEPKWRWVEIDSRDGVVSDKPQP